MASSSTLGGADESARRLRSVREGSLLAGPETLQINLRNGCNLNCTFCWNHSPLQLPKSAAWHRDQLSEAHLDAIIAAVPRLRPGRVLLSGRGEPLLHPGALRLLSALQEAEVPVTIQTNGIAGPSPEELVARGVDRLLVNVSAATASGYEAVHPGRGKLLDQVVQRLRRISELRSEARRPDVTLVAIIHHGTEDEILPLLELAQEVGASAVMLKGMEFKDGLGALMLTDAGRGRIRTTLELAERRAAELGIALKAEHLSQVVAHQTPSGDFTGAVGETPCYMGWYYLRVTIDGRVMFCCKDKPVDHLDRRELHTIWRSAAYQLLRLGGRDGDLSVGLLDDRCRSCSNFTQNRRVDAQLARR